MPDLPMPDIEMPEAPAPGNLLRRRKAHVQNRVTPVELFFDLVFVFAITQISHTLLANFTPLGFARVSLLMLAIWWVWVNTAWATNWLDPDRGAVRLMLFALMFGGLILSTSIPQAFDGRGLAFGVTFAAMQIGRSAFFIWSVGRTNIVLRNNFIRILVWFSVGGVFWIAGGLADSASRLVLWSIALAVEYTGPVARFWIPWMRGSLIGDWSVEGGHIAERAAAFILIALGESIVVTGATFAETEWGAFSLVAFAVALIGSIAMWWIYFHKGAEAGAQAISSASETARLARLSYTYLHLPIVAGIVVSAVGDELLLAHPASHADYRVILSMIGGPLLFLVGTILFKRSIRNTYQLSHLVGIAVLVALVPLAEHFSPFALSAATTAVMLVVAAWEALSLAGAQRED